MNSFSSLTRTCARRYASAFQRSTSLPSSTTTSSTIIPKPSSRLLSTTSTPSNPQPQSQNQTTTTTITQENNTPSSPRYKGTISHVTPAKKIVLITRNHQTWNPKLQKYYTRPRRELVHDPNPSGALRKGDVVEYSLFTAAEEDTRRMRKEEFEKAMEEEMLLGGGVGKRRPVRFVVRRVVTPFGVGVEERMGKVAA